MKIHLSTLGGFGDSLMLSMPAKRLRELFPDSYIVCAGRKDSIQILGSNPYINELRELKNWYDFPLFSPNYDLVIDFKYGVRTFFPKESFDLDVSFEEIEKRQKSTELDLWVNDMPILRMKNWQINLERLRSEDAFGLGDKTNWYSIISYLSGLNFSPDDLYIYQQESQLPENFIAVSSPCPLRGFSKLYPDEYWNEVFKAFPDQKFLLLGISKNKCLQGENLFRYEGKLSIFKTAFAIAKSKFLISEEGGLVHVARAVKKKSIVLFGPTQKWFFSYPENVNLRADFEECKFCHNQNPFWTVKCLKSKRKYCLALEKLKPEILIEEIKKCLEVFHERKT